MAERASRDRVAADMRPPNWRAAVQVIRVSIEKKKAKIAEVNSAIATDWASVEGYKVNKKGGRIFAMLDKLEKPERDDIMRTINALADAAGWDKEITDLADQAEGKVVHLRVGVQGDDDRAGEGEGDEDEMAEVEAAVAEPAKGKGARSVAARAAEAKAKVAEQILGTKPEDETYTGDNSDLAGE